MKSLIHNENLTTLFDHSSLYIKKIDAFDCLEVMGYEFITHYERIMSTIIYQDHKKNVLLDSRFLSSDF